MSKFARLAVLFVAVLVIASLGLSSVFAQGGDTIPRGGTFLVSEGQAVAFPRNFNPYAPDPTRWAQGTMYETLMIYNPVEGGVPTPWLATAFEWSEDLLTLTYTLQEGVQWSDGEDFNADDVVFTFDMIAANTAMDRGAMLTFLESAEKIDDYTVAFHLSQVYTLAPEVIAGNLWVVPEHVWSEVEDPVTFTNEEPVATGMLTEVRTLTDQVLELCRNENYWQMGEDGESLPYIECMRMPVYQGNDPANMATANGELDWIANFIPDIENTFVAANPEHHHYYFWLGGATVQFYMNTTMAPFDDVNFRRALSLAIDYESVTSIGMYGYTEPVSPTGLGPRYADWINPEAEARAAELGQVTYDPEAAMAALDAAGYVDADGDGWRDLPDGTALAFDAQVVTGWTDWVTSVQIISQNFQDIGINATMSSLDFGVWLANLQNGDYQTSIGWGTAGNTPWDHFRNIMDSELIGDDGLANGQLWGRWTSPEADTLIDEFVATADTEEWHNIVNQLQTLYVENVVTIPLFAGPTWYEWTTYRFTGFPTEEDYYTQGSSWNWQGRTLTLTRLHCVDEAACEAAQ